MNLHEAGFKVGLLVSRLKSVGNLEDAKAVEMMVLAVQTYTARIEYLENIIKSRETAERCNHHYEHVVDSVVITEED